MFRSLRLSSTPFVGPLVMRLTRGYCPGCLGVNTWLIVDDLARVALDAGTADHKIPIELGGVLTY